MKFADIRVWPLLSCLIFQINILKVYLWCYFVDKVSDINMLSLILILIAFSIKFQCQYFYYNLTVSVATKEYSAPFYLPKIFFGKSFYRLHISLNSLLKTLLQAKNFVYVKLTVITLKRVRSAHSLNLTYKEFEYFDNESVFSLKKTN